MRFGTVCSVYHLFWSCCLEDSLCFVGECYIVHRPSRLFGQWNMEIDTVQMHTYGGIVIQSAAEISKRLGRTRRPSRLGNCQTTWIKTIIKLGCRCYVFCPCITLSPPYQMGLACLFHFFRYRIIVVGFFQRTVFADTIRFNGRVTLEVVCIVTFRTRCHNNFMACLAGSNATLFSSPGHNHSTWIEVTPFQYLVPTDDGLAL